MYVCMYVMFVWKCMYCETCRIQSVSMGLAPPGLIEQVVALDLKEYWPNKCMAGSIVLAGVCDAGDYILHM